MLEKVKRVSEKIEKQFDIKPSNDGKILKFRTKIVQGSDIFFLNDLILNETCDVELRRSGTLITILIWC